MSIALVQQTPQVQSTNPTATLTGIAAGNTLIAQFQTATAAVPNFSDTAGNNWQIATSHSFYDGVITRTVGIAYATNVVAGSSTVTCTSGATASFGLQEWTTGLAQTYLLLDQTNNGESSGTSFTTGNVTTVHADELLMGAFYNTQSTSHSHWSAGAGFTGTSGFLNQLLGEYDVVSSISTYAATASSSDSATNCGSVIATFYISPLPIFNTLVGRFNDANILVGNLLAPIWTAVNVMPVTITANVSTDQNLMSQLIPANTLNSVGRTLRGVIKGVYSTPVASTATIEIKVQLGSLTLLDITTDANAGSITNNGFSFEFDIVTQTAGSSAKFETSGRLFIDLGALSTAAAAAYIDSNHAVSSTLDITQNQTLQVTLAFSAASGSNSATQRQLILNTVN